MYKFFSVVLLAVSFAVSQHGQQNSAWKSNYLEWRSIWKDAHSQMPLHLRDLTADNLISNDSLYFYTGETKFIVAHLTIMGLREYYTVQDLDSVTVEADQKPIVNKTKDGYKITFEKKGKQSCVKSFFAFLRSLVS